MREKQRQLSLRRGKLAMKISVFFFSFSFLFLRAFFRGKLLSFLKLKKVSTYLPAHVLEEGAQPGLPGRFATAWSCNSEHVVRRGAPQKIPRRGQSFPRDWHGSFRAEAFTETFCFTIFTLPSSFIFHDVKYDERTRRSIKIKSIVIGACRHNY